MDRTDSLAGKSGLKKFDLLLKALGQYDKLAIAFSGGVDSTLLVYAALQALGPDNIIALYARSFLLPEESAAASREVFRQNFPHNACLREIPVSPLTWPEFIVNDKDRCYFCKRRIYTLFLEEISADFHVLADGTNSDDRDEDRPGLRAIEELRVITPLADVGLTKKEVRALAEKIGLSNFDIPSNSCLATRIPRNRLIDEQSLLVIASAERFLHAQGFSGCRVRLETSCAIVEVLEKDLQAFVASKNRALVRDYFYSLQLSSVVLSLKGR
jgi:pyridinium-3,5-biscarboxylic acid mononucleotide sulfurtransferase